MTSANTASSLDLWDRIGVFVSAACLIHCLLLPFAIALLPTVLPAIPENEWVHLVLTGLAAPIALIAFKRGYLLHKSLVPSSLALPGLILLFLSMLLHEPHWVESVTASIGALLLATGHILNHRLACRCNKAS